MNDFWNFLKTRKQVYRKCILDEDEKAVTRAYFIRIACDKTFKLFVVTRTPY
jgi:hypothetical protein